VGWLGPPTIEVVVLDVVVMLVRNTVLMVEVVESGPPEVVTLVRDALLVEVEAESPEPSDAGWLVFVVDEFVGGFMLMGGKVLLVVEVEVERSES